MDFWRGDTEADPELDSTARSSIEKARCRDLATCWLPWSRCSCTIHGEEALQAIVEDKTDTRRLLRTPTEFSQRSLQTGGCFTNKCAFFNPCADPYGTHYLSKTDTAGCFMTKTYTCCPKVPITNKGTSGKLAY